MKLQESGEMYLETILILSQESDSLRAVDVAKHMGITKASVSRAVHMLQDDGYLMQDANKYLTLSDVGKAYAQKIYDRHIILEAFLKAIGVSDSVASEDACKLEHYMSDESFQALRSHLGKITA